MTPEPQSFCSPLCHRGDLHAHPAIPADLAPQLRAAADLARMPYDEALARIAALAARAIRTRGKQPWIERNGPRHAAVRADAFTDHVLNASRSTRAAPQLLAYALLTVQVLRLCETGTLQEALSRLESYSSPPLA